MSTVAPTEDNRLLIPRPDARHILGGIGETKLWELEKDKEIAVERIGRRTFVTRESLLAYVERLRGEASRD